MTSPIIKELEQRQMRLDYYHIKPGDKVSVHTRIIEGDKERVQVFTGDVIAIKNGRNNTRPTITVRKFSSGYGVERIFPIHSPLIEKIELINRGVVSRGKLYYQRKRRGLESKIKVKTDWQ